MSPSQTAESDDPKREKIIEAAEQLFIKQGFSATSMEEVAAAARASKRTIYARFASKEDLFSAVMLAACRGIEAPGLAALEDHSDLRGALRDAGKATLYRVFQPRGISVLLVGIGAKNSVPKVLEIYWENGPGVAHDYVRRAILRERGRGRVNAAAAASRFMNMICGPFLYGVLFANEKLPSRARMDEELEAAIDQFIDWLEAQRG